MNNPKRKIYSEELFQQMGEQIPFMLTAFEEAIIPKGSKQTLREYMEEHKGISIDVLPKVAAAMKRIANEGGALENSLKRLEVVENREIGRFQMKMGQLGEILKPSFISAWKVFGETLELLMPSFKAMAHVLNILVYSFITGARLIIAAVSDIAANLEWLLNKFGMGGSPVAAAGIAVSPTAALGQALMNAIQTPKTKAAAQEIIVKIEAKSDEIMKMFDVSAKSMFEAQQTTIFGNLPF